MPPQATLSPKLDDLLQLLDAAPPPYDLDDITNLLQRLDGLTPDDLAEHRVFSDRCYQRNYIKQTTSYDLILCCWKPGQHSAIHDHKGSACGFRVLQGQGIETTFKQLDDGSVTPDCTTPMPRGHVCAAECHDIHAVTNHHAATTNLITLHLYAPSMPRMNDYALAPNQQPRWDAMLDAHAPAAYHQP